MSEVEKLTEAGIINAVSTLINADGDDAPEAKAALTIIIGGALINLRTIANAVEKLSNFKVLQVGNLTLGGADVERALEEGPSGITQLVSLTAEEVETIEALRRGDIVVRPKDLTYAEMTNTG